MSKFNSLGLKVVFTGKNVRENDQMVQKPCCFSAIYPVLTGHVRLVLDGKNKSAKYSENIIKSF